MKNVLLEGGTDNVGEGQGYAPLSVRYERREIELNGDKFDVACCVTEWQLSEF